MIVHSFSLEGDQFEDYAALVEALGDSPEPDCMSEVHVSGGVTLLFG